MSFTLPDLPYAKDAFGKLISAETFDYHHGKHHNSYVKKTNALIADNKDLSGANLSEVIKVAKERGDNGLFNNSAQIWNHSFYWLGLSPEKQKPSSKLQVLIDDDFGNTEAMLKKLKDVATGHFASGWAWLIFNKGRLDITSLHDADTPVVHGMTPLLTLDVWEHAYYIDYRNARPDYVDALMNNAINWEFVEQNLDGKGISRADQG